MQKVLLLGSTGSIGQSALNCIQRFSQRFSVCALAAGTNCSRLISQIERFSPEAVYLAESTGLQEIKARYGSRLKIFEGPEGLEKLVNSVECDIVINALVGAVGLRPTIAALKLKRRVALANKESLVIGGDYIRSLLAQGYGELIPVDSEHSAILQCLNGSSRSVVESIILTASGGPFRNHPVEEFSKITPQQALKHPTWEMGKKITIDSATLMNKGFEIIEAHHLFDISYDFLRVWIHPQSIIHSLVEFHDGAILAQLGLPDMELPIQYALTFPERLPMCGKRLSLPQIRSLDFADPDLDKFSCLKTCIQAGKIGGTAPAVVNAANEIAVASFLAGTIKFTDIAAMTAYALRTHKAVAASSIEIIEQADHETRKNILQSYFSEGVK
ncbi:MAG TPA: 1-deoxy-D-xylulose-5-phosphate reductoisomerase [Chitinispirillaceae bacterium]|nr:1-deoxy-D-xylulose-5-phosphate reductoisomerase [Chitinispirillaceae bacterium]